MGQRPRPSFETTYPDQLIAVCTRAQAELLSAYDHHTVRVQGQLGVLLTYPWWPVEDASEPFLLTIVFHYAQQHPPAPPAIQAVIDQLTFEPLK
jgi:hypothetical protein